MSSLSSFLVAPADRLSRVGRATFSRSNAHTLQIFFLPDFPAAIIPHGFGICLASIAPESPPSTQITFSPQTFLFQTFPLSLQAGYPPAVFFSSGPCLIFFNPIFPEQNLDLRSFPSAPFPFKSERLPPGGARPVPAGVTLRRTFPCPATKNISSFLFQA